MPFLKIRNFGAAEARSLHNSSIHKITMLSLDASQSLILDPLFILVLFIALNGNFLTLKRYCRISVLLPLLPTSIN